MHRRTFLAAAFVPFAAGIVAAQESQARRQLGRMRGELGDPLEEIISQMASTGITPRRRQRGDYRIFTYPFGDESQLIFTFEPREDGRRGLVLYSIDLKE